MNLKIETLEAIKNSGYTQKEVLWVGSEDGELQLPLQKFLAIADVDYDSGSGAQEIAADLIVMFSDGRYIVRNEYEGSEGWSVINRKNNTKKGKPFTTVCVNQVGKLGWETLKELNK